ncbi:hypothetical protein AAZX31_19G063700 [Glycine max]
MYPLRFKTFGLHFKLCLNKTKDFLLIINTKVVNNPRDKNYIRILGRVNSLCLQHDINNNVDPVDLQLPLHKTDKEKILLSQLSMIAPPQSNNPSNHIGQKLVLKHQRSNTKTFLSFCFCNNNISRKESSSLACTSQPC